ncbi:MAG TPA: DUF3597 domain-containing protein [Steroidobacteraceae bacterium]|nr:DUF3597 domain-containing protein [Steroidobacteraceae bacterium]
MSIFGKILDKLGLRKDKAPPSTSTQAQGGRPTTSAGPTQTTPHTSAPGAQRTAPPPAARQAEAARPAQPKPQAMSETDVVAKLERLAADNPQKLNWRASIVDLMKLLGMESSLAERKELAAELGYPRDAMDDTAKMNIWLHKQVLRKIAENGGNVPKELLD